MAYDVEYVIPNPKSAKKSAVVGFAEFVDFVEIVGRTSNPRRVFLDLSKVMFAHPSGMAPMVAFIRHLHETGCVVDVALPMTRDLDDYFAKAGWKDGIEGTRIGYRRAWPGKTYLPLSTYQNHEELNPIISDTIRHINRTLDLGPGVIEALEWSLNEVADNVLNHSGGAMGYLQVVDLGRGILNSLQESRPNLKSDEEALKLAVEKGVTRDLNVGQGNGLAGTWRIAIASNGYANLYSGRGLLRYLAPRDDSSAGGPRQRYRDVPGEIFVQSAPYFPGTIVSITIPRNQKVDITKALWGHNPMSQLEEVFLSDTGECIVFDVVKHASGYGNRASARPLRTEVENLLKQFPGKRIEISFNSVNLISASFADEFVARLAKELGIATFFQRVSITHTTEFVRRTLDVVIQQRLQSR
jgi:hypothetical protein